MDYNQFKKYLNNRVAQEDKRDRDYIIQNSDKVTSSLNAQNQQIQSIISRGEDASGYLSAYKSSLNRVHKLLQGTDAEKSGSDFIQSHLQAANLFQQASDAIAKRNQLYKKLDNNKKDQVTSFLKNPFKDKFERENNSAEYYKNNQNQKEEEQRIKDQIADLDEKISPYLEVDATKDRLEDNKSANKETIKSALPALPLMAVSPLYGTAYVAAKAKDMYDSYKKKSRAEKDYQQARLNQNYLTGEELLKNKNIRELAEKAGRANSDASESAAAAAAGSIIASKSGVTNPESQNAAIKQREKEELVAELTTEIKKTGFEGDNKELETIVNYLLDKETRNSNYIKALEENKKIKESTAEHPFLMNALGAIYSGYAKLPGAVYATANAVEDLVSDEPVQNDVYSPYFSGTRENNAVREQTAELIQQHYSKKYSDPEEAKEKADKATKKYETAMSMAENTARLISMPLGAEFAAIPTAMMSFGVVSDVAYEKTLQGYSPAEAGFFSSIAGAAEFITEMVGMEKLFGALSNGRAGFTKSIATAFGAEGAEEIASDVINNAADILFELLSDSMSGRQKEIQQMMNQGMSFYEAAKKYTKDNIKQTIDDGIIGGISGAIFGAGAGTVNFARSSSAIASNIYSSAKQARKVNKQTVDDILNMPDNDGDFLTRKDAENYAKATGQWVSGNAYYEQLINEAKNSTDAKTSKMGFEAEDVYQRNGGKPSVYKAGRLINAINNANIKTTSGQVAQMLESVGVADKVIGAVQQAVKGEELSSKDIRLIKSSPDAMNILSQLYENVTGENIELDERTSAEEIEEVASKLYAATFRGDSSTVGTLYRKAAAMRADNTIGYNGMKGLTAGYNENMNLSPDEYATMYAYAYNLAKSGKSREEVFYTLDENYPAGTQEETIFRSAAIERAIGTAQSDIVYEAKRAKLQAAEEAKSRKKQKKAGKAAEAVEEKKAESSEAEEKVSKELIEKADKLSNLSASEKAEKYKNGGAIVETSQKLDIGQLARISFCDFRGKKYGITYRFVDEVESNPNARGEYNHQTEVITIRIGSVEDMSATAGHELGHWLKAHYKDEYEQLQQYLKDTVFKTNYEAKVAAKIEAYKKAGITIDDPAAFDELTNDCLFGVDMASSDFEECVKANESLMLKAFRFIRELLQDLQHFMEDWRKQLPGLFKNVTEVSMVQELYDDIEFMEYTADWVDRILNKSTASEQSAASEQTTDAGEQKNSTTAKSGVDYAVSSEKSNSSFQVSDTAYMQAARNGDVETCQRMVAQAAKERWGAYTGKDGKPIYFYHQTAEDFTVFDTSRPGAGKSDYETPSGIFIKPHNRDIGLKGKKQMPLFAFIKNPLVFKDRAAAARYYSQHVKGYADIVAEISSIDNRFSQMYNELDKALDEEYIKYRKARIEGRISKTEYKKRIDEAQKKADVLFEKWGEASNRAGEQAKELITAYFEKSDFDAVIIEKDAGSFGRSTETFIVFDSSQVKSADPITYDESGEIIPLSERFSDSKDIRYQVKDSDGNTLSQGQAEFFKNSKVIDSAGNLLVLYHGTPNEFYVFDTQKHGGKNGWAFGRGINLTSDKSLAGRFGERIMPLYANIERPAQADKITISQEELTSLVKASAEYEAQRWVNDGEYDSVEEALPDGFISLYGGTYSQAARQLLDSNTNDVDIIMEIMNTIGLNHTYADAAAFYDNVLTPSIGIDGFQSGNVFITFHSSQNKLVSNKAPTNNEDVRYSIADITDGEKFVKIDENEIDLKNGESIAKNIATILNTKFNNLIVVNKQFIRVNQKTNKEFRSSSWATRLFGDHPDWYEDKIKALANADEILKAAQNWVNEELKHSRKDNIVSFGRAHVLYMVGASGYEADVLVGVRADGSALLYDIIDIKDKKITEAPAKVGKTNSRPVRNASASSILPQNSDEVNQISDNTLTPEQQAAIERKAQRREMAKLERENENLKEALEYARRQTKISKDFRHDRSQTPKIAKKLLKQLSVVDLTESEQKEFIAALDALFDRIDESNLEGTGGSDVIYMAALEAVEVIKDNIQYTEKYEELADRAQEFADYFKGRTYISEAQAKELRYHFGGVDKANQLVHGLNFAIAKGGETTLDMQWREIMETFPDFISEELTDTDEPLAIIKAMQDAREMIDGTLYSPFDENRLEERADAEELGSVWAAEQEQMNDLAVKLMDAYTEAEWRATYADKAKGREQVQLIRQRQELRQRMEKYRSQVNDRNLAYREKLRKDYRKRYHKAISRNDLRVKMEKERLARYKERVQESRKKATERKRQTEYKNKIKKIAFELGSMAANPNKKKHIPSGILKTTHEFLSMIETGDMTQERLNHYIGAITQEFDSLENGVIYEALKSDYNAKIHDMLKEVVNRDESIRLKELSSEDLEKVYKIARVIKRAVSEMNMFHYVDKNRTVVDYQNALIEERKGKIKLKESGLQGAYRKFRDNELKPVYFFESLNSPTMTKLYQALRAGQAVVAQDTREAEKVMLRLRKKHGYSKWDLQKKYKFKLEHCNEANEVELTLPQIMSLKALSEREAGLNHLLDGGFQIRYGTDARRTIKGKLKSRIDKTEYRITADELQTIIDTLTPEQVAFVHDMRDYLAHELSKKGNEVSRKMWDIEIFGEDKYFPIHTSDDFNAKGDQKVIEGKMLKNWGSSKQLVPHAHNPLVLEEFGDAWAGHVEEMANYHAFTLPLEDFQKVYGYSNVLTADEEHQLQETNPDDKILQTVSIQNLFTNSQQSYIEKFIGDVNGSIIKSDETLSTRGVSKYKKISTALNLRVTVQQPGAIARAFLYISPKYFAQTTGTGLKGIKSDSAAVQEMEKYSDAAFFKSLGFFDVGEGRSIKEYLNPESYEGKQKFTALAYDSDYRDSKMLAAPEMMDRITWVHIWEATKAKVAAEEHLTGEALRNRTGEVFNDVVDKTQVYDSIFTRSGHMRSNNPFAKMATAFLAEPTTTINMYHHAWTQYRMGNVKKGFVAKAFAACFTATFLTNLLASVVSAMRHGKDDDNWWELWVGEFTSDFLTDIVLVNSLPLVRDIFSIAKGWDVGRSDMALVGDFINAVKKLNKAQQEDRVTYKEWIDFISAAASLADIPLTSIKKDIFGAFQAARIWSNGTKPTSTGIQKAILSGWYDASAIDDLLALEQPSTNKYDTIYNLISAGKYEEANSRKEHLIQSELKEAKPEYGETREEMEKRIREKIDSGLDNYIKQQMFDKSDFERVYQIMLNSGKNQAAKFKEQLLKEALENAVVLEGEDIKKAQERVEQQFEDSYHSFMQGKIEDKSDIASAADELGTGKTEKVKELLTKYENMGFDEEEILKSIYKNINDKIPEGEDFSRDGALFKVSYSRSLEANALINTPEMKKAGQADMEHDIKERVHIQNAMLKKGYTQDDIRRATDYIKSQLKGKGEESENTEKSIYSASDVAWATLKADGATVRVCSKGYIEYFLKTHKDKSEKDAKKSIKSQISSIVKNEYYTANESRRAEIRKLMWNSGVYDSVDDVNKAANKWVKDIAKQKFNN